MFCFSVFLQLVNIFLIREGQLQPLLRFFFSLEWNSFLTVGLPNLLEPPVCLAPIGTGRVPPVPITISTRNYNAPSPLHLHCFGQSFRCQSRVQIRDLFPSFFVSFFGIRLPPVCLPCLSNSRLLPRCVHCRRRRLLIHSGAFFTSAIQNSSFLRYTTILYLASPSDP